MFVQIFIVLVITFMFFLKRRKDKEGLPPGDWTLPVIGKLILTPEEHISFIREQKKKHGNIFSSQSGSRTTIYLADYAIVKEAFAKPEFSERVQNVSNYIINLNTDMGIMFGSKWAESRHFAMKHLKDLGMGKKSFEPTIMREVTDLLEYFKRSKGAPTSIDDVIHVPMVNIIMGILADHRYQIGESKRHEITEYVRDMILPMRGLYTLLDLFPILDTIIPTVVKNKLMGMEKIQGAVSNLTQFGRVLVKEHEKNLDRSNPRDFIDFYLMERQDEQKRGQKTLKSEEMDLISNLFILYAAGSDTNAFTLRWLILYMARFQDVQAKVQKELDAVVPDSRLPSLEDKAQLPYLEATILEGSRKATIVPLGISHSNFQEAKINGYRIPKDSTIIPCLEEIHHDPRYWKHPDQFYPEHFINENGEVNNWKEGFLPFGIGRRVCLGESLARMTLFLAFAAIMKEFTIKPVPGEDLNLEPDRTHFNNMPKPFKVVIQKRLIPQ